MSAAKPTVGALLLAWLAAEENGSIGHFERFPESRGVELPECSDEIKADWSRVCRRRELATRALTERAELLRAAGAQAAPELDGGPSQPTGARRWHVTVRSQDAGRTVLSGYAVAVTVEPDELDHAAAADAADIADGFTDTAIRAAIVRAIDDDDSTVVCVERDGVAI